MRKNRTIFITATDTGVGKTITCLCLGALLKAKGYRVGVMKPVQCAGDDVQFLKQKLQLQDDLKSINPFYAPEPLSPHLAFRRAKIKFDQRKVQKCLKVLQRDHEIVLIEGAGGLMVPITDDYYNADLIKDLKAEVIIVTRLGLGTINHTLLTINELEKRKLKILGLIFCQTKPGKKSIPESTNPEEISKLSGIKVLGIIPYFKKFNVKDVPLQCQNFELNI